MMPINIIFMQGPFTNFVSDLSSTEEDYEMVWEVMEEANKWPLS